MIIKTDNDIFVEETEIIPNRYASLVLICCVILVTVCFVFTELGIFRVGLYEMRMGTVLTLLSSSLPLFLFFFNKKSFANRKTKYFVVAAISIFTLCSTSLLTFHTTILLIFPIFFAMLYRSKNVGIFAMISSILITIFSPILGYVLGTWDIELFKELILIGTNGTAVIENAYQGLSLLNVGKILLYLVFPHMMLIGSCSVLMFYIIKISTDHVKNEIVINRLSHNDSLTGLYNQNYFKELISHNLNDESTVGVVFFDVNGLKIANDNGGHELGDIMLQRCAKSISDSLVEKKSFGFRLGGDEFAVLITDCDDWDLDLFIDTWNFSIEKINEENKTLYDNLVCSMAYGTSFGKGNNLENLVKYADEKMYQNKAAMKEKTN